MLCKKLTKLPPEFEIIKVYYVINLISSQPLCNCSLCSVILFLLNALLSAIFFFNDLAFYKQFLSIKTEITTAVLDGKHETPLIMEPTRYFTDNLYILLFLAQMPILFASILITYCHSTLFDTIICITYVIVWNFHNFSVSYL